jgi:predicted N-acetyltransferase YhbS
VTVELVRRHLRRDELPLIWRIDRRESVERIFELRDGELVSRADPFDIRGWPPGEPEKAAPILEAAFDRGGAFLAAFDDTRLAALAVVDTLPLGPSGDLRQLTFLHVGHDYRRRGLGSELFEASQEFVAGRGGRGLYVSATPSENTVRFYVHRGCRVVQEPDPDLFALEPADIHFECRVGTTRT